MSDRLSGDELMRHVRALADEIGPRPAGTPRESQAHDYVRSALNECGIGEVETLHFDAPPTWMYAILYPTALALAGNVLLRGRVGRLLSGLVSLFSAYCLWQTTGSQRSALAGLAPAGPSATQVVRIPARGATRHKLVFIGHVDANKHRLSCSPTLKHWLLASTTTLLVSLGLNGIIQLIRALGPRHALRLDYRLSLAGLVTGVVTVLADDAGPFIPGANDNATAVACLLGLAQHLHAHPLEHTEVWVAFTGAEEVGGLGTHALLDAHGDQLKDAYFFDFEMVGAGELAYVSHHSGLTGFNGYTPDAESASLAAETARAYPELKVSGRSMTILEEVGALRGRGYRGLCLVGVGGDGFLVNWHQNTDISAHIIPETLERAAQFGLAYARTLDQKA